MTGSLCTEPRLLHFHNEDWEMCLVIAYRLPDRPFQNLNRFFFCSTILNCLVLTRICQMNIFYKTSRICFFLFCFYIHSCSHGYQILIIRNLFSIYRNGGLSGHCTERFFYLFFFHDQSVSFSTKYDTLFFQDPRKPLPAPLS